MLYFQVTSSSEDMKYYVNPCGAISTGEDFSKDCKNAAVCQVNNQKQGTIFGNAQNETFIMEGDRLKVGYINGESCTSSSKLTLFFQ